MRTQTAGLALAAVVALTACEPLPLPNDTQSDTGATDSTAEAPNSLTALDRVDSCDEVAAAVGQYIVGLVAAKDNGVDADGVLCRWRTPPDVRELEDIRSVEVILTPADPTDAPHEDEMDDLTGVLLLEDERLDRLGGIAYELLLAGDQGGVITTTVWVPGIVATVVGGQWSDLPALDGSAAIDVVLDLLG